MSEKPKTGARAPEARRRVTLERVYQAAVQDVWDLWTTKDGIESRWFRPHAESARRDRDARPLGGQDFERDLNA